MQIGFVSFEVPILFDGVEHGQTMSQHAPPLWVLDDVVLFKFLSAFFIYLVGVSTLVVLYKYKSE